MAVQSDVLVELNVLVLVLKTEDEGTSPGGQAAHGSQKRWGKESQKGIHPSPHFDLSLVRPMSDFQQRNYKLLIVTVNKLKLIIQLINVSQVTSIVAVLL